MVKHLNSVPSVTIQKGNDVPNQQTVNSQEFARALDRAIKQSSAAQEQGGLTFSKHALSRLQERNIMLDPESVGRLDGAIDKAAKKGSKESLIISDKAAFIVNVPKRRIITALDRAQMQENVFTNIDSTVIA